LHDRRLDQPDKRDLPAATFVTHRRDHRCRPDHASAVTATLVRRGNPTRGPVAMRPDAPPAERRAPGAGYASYAGYERAARDLAATLDARRSALSPETVAKVEASLRVIDSAIAEARAALARDPGNQALVELLGVSYRQKLDVLHRAAELSTEI